ncbi:MAG: ABC-F family ATP-binding cassette domain-containing protein [Planctomycetota bacterium]
MAVLIQLKNAHKRYGDQTLLEGAEVSIVSDTKVGFVGRNGAGKSTVLRVLLGEEELDAGDIQKHPSLRVGYIRQHDPFVAGESAMDFLIRDSQAPEWKCGEVAGRFELKGDYLYGPVSELSGGWQTRVKLAALLLHDPNLLLLDEPTNFLDLRTQILLEHFLLDFRAACLIVSHDREFLKQTCSHTLDISRGKLTMYPGKIDDFLEFQQERIDHDRRVNATVVAKQKQLQKFIDKNRAHANTASQARSKQKQLDRLETIEIDAELATARIHAPRVQPRKGPAVRSEELVIGYEGHEVAANINLEIEHGQRAAIVGDNGQGKTTLLRSLTGSLDTLGGEVRWGHNCDIGVYAQHVYTTLPEDRTVLEHLEYNADKHVTTQDCLAIAGALLFRDSHVKKKIKVLSGGERARVCLAGLLLGSYNILVMDEPGNHLDVETIEALAEALIDYKGTVLFTSHDRHFLSRVATNIIEVRDGSAKNYHGNYESYLYYINKEIEEGERAARANIISSKGSSGKNGPSGKSGSFTEEKQSQKDHRKRQKLIKTIERKIARLDEEKKELNGKLLTETDPDKAMELHEQITQISNELSEAEDQWLELTE